MALEKPISNATIVVEPKAKRKYKTKNEKEVVVEPKAKRKYKTTNEKEDTTFKEFLTLGKILVEDDLPKEEVQSLRVPTTHLGFYN
jgi:hypothetical protein